MFNDLKVHSIETFGTHDGPGIRLVLFLQGCCFDCLYCQNPDAKDPLGTEAKEMTVSEIIAQLEKMRPYFRNGKGGISISGGEPTLQAKNLIPLFEECKDKGFHTALDTCGGIHTETTRKLYELTDLVILDIKHINENWHKTVTGASNINPLKNAQYREETGKPLWLRYVLVPGYTDQEEYLHEWGKTFQDFKSLERVEILPYHTLGAYKYEKLGQEYRLKDLKPPSPEQVEKARLIFAQYFDNLVVR